MRALLALALAVASCPSALASEPEPAASSAPVRRGRSTQPVFGAPLKLRFLVDERGKTRGELGFAVRWELKDIPSLPRRAAMLAIDPFGTTERAAREALSGADLGVYTLRLRASTLLPIGFLLSPLTLVADAFAPPDFVAAAVSVGEPPGPPPPATPRARLSLMPARAEIEQELERSLRRSLIEAGFDLAVPLNRRVPYAEKKAVYDGLRRSGDIIEEDRR